MIKNPKAKVLVIEDEKGIRSLLSYELEQRGYQVDTAADGEEGVEKVKVEKYDLIITDIIMPKMNGLQALKAIKKISPETEVIVVTGYATVENALQSMRDGAYDFVQKPFNLSELFALVEKALEKGELKTLVALYESSQIIYSTLKLEELLPNIIKLIKDVIKADEVALLLFDHKNQFYLAASSFSMVDINLRDFYTKLANNLFQSNKMLNEPYVFETPLENDKIVQQSGKDVEIKSLIASPLISRNKKIGVIFAARKKANMIFSNSDIRNLSIFVTQIAQSIMNTKLYEQLEIKISELESANKQLENMKTK